MYHESMFILYYDQQMHNYFTNYQFPTCFDTIVSSPYVSDQYDSNIYLQILHTTTTQTDFMRIVASKLIWTHFFCK